MKVPSQVVARATPWAKLWLYARGIDERGDGHVTVKLCKVKKFLKAAKSTIYEWLREGKAVGAFREYWVANGDLTLYYGSLKNVCLALRLSDWGATVEVSLEEVRNIKAIATGAAAQDLQNKSRVAATRAIKKTSRRFIKVPSVEQILNGVEPSSPESVKGEIPCLFKFGNKRIFVSRGFVHFGTSQQTIAATVGRSVRTVQRHLAKLNPKRRQIVQAKAAYRRVKFAMLHGSGEFYAEPALYYQSWVGDAVVLRESQPWTTPGCEAKHLVKSDRLFEYGGKVWIYRCNLYDLRFTLKSMRVARNRYKSLQNSQVSDRTVCKGSSGDRNKGRQKA